MIDKDKMINILLRYKSFTFGDRTYDGIQFTIADVIDLLKEQEAVKPKTESSVYDPDTWFFVCGSCKKGVIAPEDKFCRWCGQAVKW